MSIPTIKIGDDNWAVKPNLLLGYNNTNGIYIPREFTVSRGTTALEVNSEGILTIANNNIARIDYLNFTKGALFIEASGKNEIRNNSMVGAVAGTPGNLPNNWAEIAGNNLPYEVVGVGADNGVQYIDLRFSGTASGNLIAIRFEAGSVIVAANGQTWTESAWLGVIAAPQPPSSYLLRIDERTAAGNFVTGGDQAIVPTSTLTRFSFTRTLSGGAIVERVQPLLRITIVSGQSYDFTIRIGYPQMELSSFATSVIPTTSGAVSRAADVISASGVSGLIGQTEGTIYAEVDYRNFSTADQPIVQLFLDASNRFGIAAYRSGPDNRFQGYVVLGGGVPVNIAYIIPSAGIYKIAFGYKLDDYVLYINGTLIGSDTSGGVVAATSIQLGHNNSTNFLNDRIRAAAVYTSRLSNDNLMLLTLPTNDGYLPTSIWNYYLSKPGVSEVSDCLYERYFNILNI